MIKELLRYLFCYVPFSRRDFEEEKRKLFRGRWVTEADIRAEALA